MNGFLFLTGLVLLSSIVSCTPDPERLEAEPAEAEVPRGFTIPLIDLAAETHRHVVVDKEDGQYLGHPTTVLLGDSATLITVYPKGHGKGGIVMKRSPDGGLTWSERLPVPESWATSQEVPTLYPVIDPEGVKRLIMFSGLHPIRMAVSEDDGLSWSELEPMLTLCMIQLGFQPSSSCFQKEDLNP